MQQTPPGWYPSPTQPGQQQYWDGANWTEHYAQPYAKKKTPVWLIILLTVGVLGIGLVGCVGLVASTYFESAISAEEYNSISIGTDKQTIIDDLGDPYDSYRGEDDLGEYSCITYNSTTDLAATYQFCFEEDNTMSTKQIIDGT